MRGFIISVLVIVSVIGIASLATIGINAARAPKASTFSPVYHRCSNCNALNNVEPDAIGWACQYCWTLHSADSGIVDPSDL